MSDEGELKKRIKNNSIPDSILTDQEVIFHKNLFPILDEAAKDFPKKKFDADADRESYAEDDIEAWFKNWFGSNVPQDA